MYSEFAPPHSILTTSGRMFWFWWPKTSSYVYHVSNFLLPNHCIWKLNIARNVALPAIFFFHHCCLYSLYKSSTADQSTSLYRSHLCGRTPCLALSLGRDEINKFYAFFSSLGNTNIMQINWSMHSLQTEYAHTVRNKCITYNGHQRNNTRRPRFLGVTKSKGLEPF